MKPQIARLLAAAVIGLGLCVWAVPAEAATILKSICRVKGQEENSLQGLGLVVGLKGTGDSASYLPTINALAKILSVLGEPLNQGGLAELKDTKNVAVVIVTATVPAAGARQGDKLDCAVSSIGDAKDLTGGRLFLSALQGPDPNDPRFYAFAQGPVSLDDPTLTTTGRIHDGCRLEADLFNAFTQNGRIVLVLDKNHADFEVAADVAELINSQLSFQSSGIPLAKALDQANVAVEIPSQYREDPVEFVSQVLALPMLEPATAARVVINERAGSIVISGEVEIGAVVVTHKNVVVEAGAAASPAFDVIDLDPTQTNAPKLKALVEALDAVHVAREDTIDIIRGLDRAGKLHGKLIIE